MVQSNMAVIYPYISSMASGNHCIKICDCTYEQFPDLADKWQKILEARFISEANGPDSRLRKITLQNETFYLAMDEFEYELSLEPVTDEASTLIEFLFEKIQSCYDRE